MENTPSTPLTSPDVSPAPESTPTPEPAPAPVAPVSEPEKPTSGEPRNLLAAMALTSWVGFFGLHQVYLGRKTQGWVRFGLALAVMFLGWLLLPLLAVPVLLIWAAVDFFLVYLKREDGQGQPLQATKRDETGAKVIFISYIVFWALYLLLFVVLFVTGVLASLNPANQQMNTPYQTSPYSTYDSSLYR